MDNPVVMWRHTEVTGGWGGQETEGSHKVRVCSGSWGVLTEWTLSTRQLTTARHHHHDWRLVIVASTNLVTEASHVTVCCIDYCGELIWFVYSKYHSLHWFDWRECWWDVLVNSCSSLLVLVCFFERCVTDKSSTLPTISYYSDFISGVTTNEKYFKFIRNIKHQIKYYRIWTTIEKSGLHLSWLGRVARKVVLLRDWDEVVPGHTRSPGLSRPEFLKVYLIIFIILVYVTTRFEEAS